MDAVLYVFFGLNFLSCVVNGMAGNIFIAYLNGFVSAGCIFTALLTRLLTRRWKK